MTQRQCAFFCAYASSILDSSRLPVPPPPISQVEADRKNFLQTLRSGQGHPHSCSAAPLFTRVLLLATSLCAHQFLFASMHAFVSSRFFSSALDVHLWLLRFTRSVCQHCLSCQILDLMQFSSETQPKAILRVHFGSAGIFPNTGSLLPFCCAPCLCICCLSDGRKDTQSASLLESPYPTDCVAEARGPSLEGTVLRSIETAGVRFP